jgi:DNA-directed DNA polymerase III PolC
MARFACLRAHSWFSLLEGTASPAALLERAEELGYGSVALTDTNNLHGAVAYLEAARGSKVRPILGAHLRQQSQRATALIAEPAGWHSLCAIISRLHAQPSASLAAVLCEHAEGLHLVVDDPMLLKAPLTDVFRNRLWLEVVRPGRSEASERILLEAGSRLGCRPVASLNAYLGAASDHAAYRLLAAVRQGVTLDQLPARLPVLPAHHLAPAEEILERFRDMPNAVANTLILADLCRSDVLPRGIQVLPTKLPVGQDPHEHLRLTCERALQQRYSATDRAAEARLEQELSLIAERDLSAYFLAVADIAAEVRRRGWPLALRGSAGSSLVCHLLGISDIDPLKHGLRVERFLHAGRQALPDIDLDLASQLRGRVWSWILSRYGHDHVGRVGVIEHLQERSAFRAACAAHALTPQQTDALLEALGDSVEGIGSEGTIPLPPASWPLEPQAWARVVAGARALTGRPRQLGAHPSGILLSADPTGRLVPLQRVPGGAQLCQLDKHAVAVVGLVKIDLLGNRALSTLAEAGQHLQALEPQQATPPVGADAATAALLGRGDTLGISQLERPAMRRLLRAAAPQSLQDLAQVMAIARPGAAGGRDTYLRRRRGIEKVVWTHPCLEPVLRESLGVILYEDDALSVAEAMTALPASEADRLRRALADPTARDGASGAFLAACERNAVPAAAARAVLEQLSRFEGYSFCKSHALSYALIAWQEAHLKAHHPLAFWTAALNSHQGDYPRWAYVEQIKRAGLSVNLPCVNRSQAAWTQEVSGLRAGLSAVRTLGAAGLSAVLEERERGGPFGSFADFRRRVTLSGQDLAALIRAGAMDCWGRGRASLLRDADVARPGLTARHREGQEPWPSDAVPAGHPLAGQWQQEWEVLGFFSGPPLLSLLRASLPPGLADTRSLPALVGKKVHLAGLVLSGGESGAERVLLEDEWGTVEAVLPQPEGEPAPLGITAVLEGKVEERHGQPLLVAGEEWNVTDGTPQPRQGAGGNGLAKAR